MDKHQRGYEAEEYFIPIKTQEMSDFIVINKSDDTIIYEVAKLMRMRADKGKDTYGTTMDRDDLSTEQWLNHAIEEALDLAIYLTKIKKDFEGLKVI